MKKLLIIFLLVLLTITLSSCEQEEVYTKDEVDELIELILTVAEDEDLYYLDGDICEYDNGTGGTTCYTIEEYKTKE